MLVIQSESFCSSVTVPWFCCGLVVFCLVFQGGSVWGLFWFVCVGGGLFVVVFCFSHLLSVFSAQSWILSGMELHTDGMQF